MEAYTHDLTHGTKKHTCVSSEWNLSPFFTLHGGVPYNEQYISDLKHACFREPGLYVGVVVVAVDDPAVNPMSTVGKWERISPEEPFFARLLAIKDAIDQGASEETLISYRRDIFGRISRDAADSGDGDTV